MNHYPQGHIEHVARIHHEELLLAGQARRRAQEAAPTIKSTRRELTWHPRRRVRRIAVVVGLVTAISAGTAYALTDGGDDSPAPAVSSDSRSYGPWMTAM